MQEVYRCSVIGSEGFHTQSQACAFSGAMACRIGSGIGSIHSSDLLFVSGKHKSQPNLTSGKTDQLLQGKCIASLQHRGVKHHICWSWMGGVLVSKCGSGGHSFG